MTVTYTLDAQSLHIFNRVRGIQPEGGWVDPYHRLKVIFQNNLLGKGPELAICDFIINAIRSAATSVDLGWLDIAPESAWAMRPETTSTLWLELIRERIFSVYPLSLLRDLVEGWQQKHLPGHICVTPPSNKPLDRTYPRISDFAHRDRQNIYAEWLWRKYLGVPPVFRLCPMRTPYFFVGMPSDPQGYNAEIEVVTAALGHLYARKHSLTTPELPTMSHALSTYLSRVTLSSAAYIVNPLEPAPPSMVRDRPIPGEFQGHPVNTLPILKAATEATWGMEALGRLRLTPAEGQRFTREGKLLWRTTVNVI